MEEPTIGIDLGTTYSCVAVIQNEKPLIIEIDNGLKTMASVVSYTKNGRVIGDKAKENFLYDPTSTIYAVKRIIGCRYKDIVKENTLHKYPVEIIDDNDSPRYKVELNGAECLFSPEEVSATILEKLKESAEKCLNMAITKAVITVPAHFNDSQRQATKDAGRIAGLDVLRIINEPTAAALAYGIHKKYKNQNDACQVLVYDFGGGTFDVSIISIDDGIFEVKSTTGDTRLGGDDIDELLVNYFVQEFNSRYNLKLMNDRRAIRRLRLKCENLKKNLSDCEKSAIEIDSLHDGIDFFSGISRTVFDQLCIPLITKTLMYVQDALNDANMSISEIDEVVLVGGTTRMPIVRKMVQRFFNGKKLNLSQNPDEAVAIGAAVQAAILDNNYQDSEILGSLLLMDVISLSLGVETVGGVMDIIIPRNTAIPTEITKEYSTAFDKQKSVRISVFEGERMKVNENCLLGSFSLKGIKPAPRNEPKILITFIINTDGILNVTATETKKNISMSLDIHMDKNRLSNGEIEGLILEAAKLRKEDAKWEEKISACLHLEHYCLELKHMVTETLRASVTDEHKQIVLLKCDEVLKWAKINGEEDKEIYAKKKKEVYNVCHSLIKLYL